MKQIIIEVGSTVTKVDEEKNNELRRINEKTIQFKKHYKEENKLNWSDVEELISLVNNLKEEKTNLYICGTSIFRDLKDNEKSEFLTYFKTKTGHNFEIISAKEENELTVLGATRFINNKACIFIGGGGSTELAIFDKEIKESANSNIGVIDAMENFKDLNEDIAFSKIETVKKFVKSRLNLPKEKADILILAGGDHEKFIREAKIKHEPNDLYEDPNAPIKMDLLTRTEETEKFFYKISLDEIKGRVEDPAWWYATRMMCIFVLVVAESIDAKYIIPTNLGMSYGILEKLKRNNK